VLCENDRTFSRHFWGDAMSRLGKALLIGFVALLVLIALGSTFTIG